MYNYNFAQMYSLICTGFSDERFGPWASCLMFIQLTDITDYSLDMNTSEPKAYLTLKDGQSNNYASVYDAIG